MSEVNEQRVCIKFCLKLGKNATETYEMIKTAFGDDSLSRSKIFEWFKRFKNGRETTEDDPRSGRPSTSRNDDVVSKICEKVRNDRRLTVRELADEAGISIGSCHEILTENLQMRRVAAKFVPRLLTLEQKENRLTICQDLKNRSIDPNFIKNIVTGDETWVYGYDPETKAQSSQWKTKFSPRPKKARKVRSSVKTMLIVFFDIEGIVHYEFVPHGQTVNQVFYKDVLMRLREKIRKKRPEKWRTETWFLHHDNAPAHSALSIREFLADKKIPVVPHPPYSPDLAPCDFFLFPKLKFALKGQRFQDVEEIKANTAAELKVLTSEQFQRTFEKWQDRWNHCILSGGEYFEVNLFLSNIYFFCSQFIKMAFLQSLKAQVNCVNLSVGDLRKDVAYPVRSMKNVDTKFGIAVSCVLSDPEGTGSINVFLPKVIRIDDVDIGTYNLGVVPSVSLVYKGLNRRSFIIDFVE
ncbi:hypothetical protein QTP88_025053 [Uroleucon formosanum]